MIRSLMLAVALAATSAVVSPARAADAPEIAVDARNPAPTVALSTLGHFELAPVAMGEPWTKFDANVEARNHLQANIDERVPPLLATWNAKNAGSRTLRITPEVTDVRFISGGKRFWGGAFAGGSWMLVTVHLTDAATGEAIADPRFYQQANAWGAAYSFGATDKHMLIRLAAMLEDYLRANYDAPVGGLVRVAPGHEADLDEAKSK